MPSRDAVNWTCSTANCVFLTYSQASGIDIGDIQCHLDCLGADHHIVAHEFHEDGGDHYHCIVHFDTAQQWRQARVFDIGGRHPNVKVVRGYTNIANVLEYVTKEDDYLASSGDDTWQAFKALSTKGSGSRDATWKDIISAGDADEFWSLAEALAPYELGTKQGSLAQFVNWRYGEKRHNYIAPDVTFARVDSRMIDWVNNELVCVLLHSQG